MLDDNIISVIPKGSQPEAPPVIENTAFFPDLNVMDFRLAMRVDETVSFDRLKTSLIDAVLNVNVELAELSLTNLDAAKLADLPAEEIAGVSVKVWRYKHAVYNEAKADLMERYRDFDSTQSGHDEADKLEIGIDDYRQKSREHIRALLGKPRARIELI